MPTEKGADAPNNDGPDAQDNKDQTPPDGDKDQTPPQPGRLEDLPEWAQVYFRELRGETKKHRLALRQQEEEARKSEQARLAEEGKWKELAEQRANDLSKLTPYQERAETLEKMIRESNEARVQRVKEDMRALVPQDYPPEKLAAWLVANERLLSTPPAPNLDGGAGGSSTSTPVKLTEQEKEMARSFGMTDEEYAKFKR